MDYIETIAKVCHESNRAFCETHGDNSQKSWEESEQWQRDSSISQVEFRIANPDSAPSAQHDSWMKEKLDDGWVYGEVKDSEKKTHPCLVPYDQLPIFQQQKDALFQSVVDALKSVKTKDLTFGQATTAAKYHSKKVAREGWNASGQYVYIVPAASYPAVTEIAKQEFGEMVPYRAYWALKTAQNDIATWQPTVSDTLAEDWYIVD